MMTAESELNTATCHKVSLTSLFYEFVCVGADLKLKAIEFVKINASQNTKQKMPDAWLAKELKQEFDKMFHQTWQCIVGKHFGSQIGFERGYMIYFYIGATGILLWRCG